MSKARFTLGQIVCTPGSLEACRPFYLCPQLYFLELLHRHASGDWGTICEEDKPINEEAVQLGNRILSAYPIDAAKPCKGHGENCLWIITEADRSVTTILLPSEY